MKFFLSIFDIKSHVNIKYDVLFNAISIYDIHMNKLFKKFNASNSYPKADIPADTNSPIHKVYNHIGNRKPLCADDITNSNNIINLNLDNINSVSGGINNVDKPKINSTLFGISSISLATKRANSLMDTRELNSILINILCNNSEKNNCVINHSSINKIEKSIYESLSYNLNLPNLMEYIRFISFRGGSEDTHNLTKILVFYYLSYKSNDILPSVLVTVAHILAMHICDSNIRICKPDKKLGDEQPFSKDINYYYVLDKIRYKKDHNSFRDDVVVYENIPIYVNKSHTYTDNINTKHTYLYQGIKSTDISFPQGCTDGTIFSIKNPFLINVSVIDYYYKKLCRRIIKLYNSNIKINNLNEIIQSYILNMPPYLYKKCIQKSYISQNYKLYNFCGDRNNITTIFEEKLTDIPSRFDRCVGMRKQNTTNTFLPIKILDSDIIPIKFINEGSYGKVLKVIYNGNIYAQKKVKDELMEEFYDLESFYLIEVSTLLSLRNHKNIVTIMGVVGNYKSFILEYIEHDLKSYTKQFPYIRKIKEFQEHVTKELIEGLCYIHSLGFILRDIKPQNILIGGDWNFDSKNLQNKKSFVVKYCDFGGSKGNNIVLATIPFTGISTTMWYRPPELLLGSNTYNPSIDIWSLGCTLAEMCSGHPLFSGDSEYGQCIEIFKLLGTPCVDRYICEETFNLLINFDEDCFPKFKNIFPSYQVKFCCEKVNYIIKESLIMDQTMRPSSNKLLQCYNNYNNNNVTPTDENLFSSGEYSSMDYSPEKSINNCTNSIENSFKENERVESLNYVSKNTKEFLSCENNQSKNTNPFICHENNQYIPNIKNNRLSISV